MSMGRDCQSQRFLSLVLESQSLKSGDSLNFGLYLCIKILYPSKKNFSWFRVFIFGLIFVKARKISHLNVTFCFIWIDWRMAFTGGIMSTVIRIVITVISFSNDIHRSSATRIVFVIVSVNMRMSFRTD